MISTGAMRVGEEVRLVNTENLLDSNFRLSPGWHWQSGKMENLKIITGEDALMARPHSQVDPSGVHPLQKVNVCKYPPIGRMEILSMDGLHL